MSSEPERAMETLLSHIYNAIAEHRHSYLIGLIYDRILRLSGTSTLNRLQTEALLSLLHLPYKDIPDARNKMGNLFRDKALDRYLKSSQKYAEDDEAKIDELKILGTLNSLRRSAKCCVASLKLIREENLVSNVDFCFAHIKFHERKKKLLGTKLELCKMHS
uniref:NOC3p domain-containing protein n=1 Tax=Ascaris lumbricoides TaxID=6252 RepID=A0A0M3I8L2_ASCLU